jgi:hypothetical protein
VVDHRIIFHLVRSVEPFVRAPLRYTLRRFNRLTRDDLRFMRASWRCHWLEVKWIRTKFSRPEVTNASRREVIGNDVLAELSELLDSLDGYIADREARLWVQHSIGMLQSRIALDLGRLDEARTYALEFNGCFQLLLNLAQEEGMIADDPELWKNLTRINKDRYDEMVAAPLTG